MRQGYIHFFPVSTKIGAPKTAGIGSRVMQQMRHNLLGREVQLSSAASKFLDFVINRIERRFDQRGFLTYSKMESMLMATIKKEDFSLLLDDVDFSTILAPSTK